MYGIVLGTSTKYSVIFFLIPLFSIFFILSSFPLIRDYLHFEASNG